ncbi:MAG: extracellular solute-binding protein, partial [Dehalococcoidia bacterium]
DGKTVKINSKETVDIVTRFVQEWKNGFDETGLSWDDSSNNRAFLADQISVTNNGVSIYLTGIKSNPDIAKDMDHAVNPQGPGGRYQTWGANGFAIMSYSKSQAAAKEFLKWLFADEQFGVWFRANGGYYVPAVKKWSNDPIWTQDPKLTVLRDTAKYGRFPGWQAAPGQQSAEVLAKYLIVDMYAQAVSTGNVKASVQNAESQLKQIFNA